MKRVPYAILLLLVIAAPAWAAKKITVAQLEDLLRSFQQDKKSDAEISTALKQLELTQELTTGKMNSLVGLLPGRLSTEQVYVLEAKSADLAPPDVDLPSTPAPDAGQQKRILSKASAYVTGTYDQLPALSATRISLRFQDNVEAVSSGSGLTSGATEVDTSASFSNPATFVHYINSTENEIESTHGVEKLPQEQNKIRWGANKMIALKMPDPNLGDVFNQAQAAGDLHWLRWELVAGKQVAVFAFTVPRKKSHIEVNVCCFPTVKQEGVATFYTSTSAPLLSGGTGNGGGGVTGNFQTTTDWHAYKSSAPFHGEFFIDPENGIVARMITEAELKPSDVVHYVDTRIDYAPISVGTTQLIVPVKTVIDTEVVPNGDSGAAGYTTRHTLFTSEYKNYHLAPSK